MRDMKITRRRVLRSGMGLAGATALTGCKVFDELADTAHPARRFMERANTLTQVAQRGLLDRNARATEYAKSDIRQGQRPNGVTNPQDDAYLQLLADNFADYRLEISGLVKRPMSLSLAQLQRMRVQHQITRHDCVEGWSCIAEWTGVPLAQVLTRAGVLPAARYVLFECFDTIERSLSGGVKYYETIDLIDGFHPQTILAWGVNGQALPVPNGAPLRVRVERQLGYKMAKYIRRIVLIDDFSQLGRGRGGYWEDRGYEWYAGI